MPLDALEAKVENASAVAKWLGEYGGGYKLSGKAVVKHKDSTRPSSTELELFDPLTPSAKKDHIQLVKEQKRCLEALL